VIPTSFRIETPEQPRKAMLPRLSGRSSFVPGGCNNIPGILGAICSVPEIKQPTALESPVAPDLGQWRVSRSADNHTITTFETDPGDPAQRRDL
jgi:hypothetical protein